MTEPLAPNSGADDQTPQEIPQDELDLGLMRTVLEHCLTLVAQAEGKQVDTSSGESPVQEARRKVSAIMREAGAFLERDDDQKMFAEKAATAATLTGCTVHYYPPGVSRQLCYNRYNKLPPHPNACTNGCYGDQNKLSLCIQYSY